MLIVLRATGTADQLRTSDHSVWRSYKQNSTYKIYTPIVANGLVLDLDASNKKSLTSNVFPYATDIYSWTSAGNSANFSRDTIVSPVGNTPLKMAVTGNDPFTGTYGAPIYNLYPTTVGKTWTISVWAKSDTANTQAQISLFGANSSGSYLENNTRYITLTTNWQRFSYTYTMTNAATAYVQARLDGPDSGGAGKTIWWDGMQIEQGDSMTDFSKSSISMNVHPNPTNLYSWTSTAYNATLSRDTIASPVGITPLKMVVTGSDPQTSSYSSSPYNLAPTAASRTWTVSVWAKADAAVATPGQIFVFGANSTGAYTEVGVKDVIFTTNWQKYTYTYTATNATTVYVQTRLDGPDSGGTGRTIWWDGLQMQEGANVTSSWNDLSSVGNTGELVNGATYSNNGSSFDGTNDFVSVGNGASLNVGNNLTIGAWIKPTSLSSRYSIFSTRQTNQAGSFQFEVGTGSGGTNRVAVVGLSTWHAETANNVISPNAWQYVVYTTDGTNQNIYVNGVNQPITTAAYTFINNTDYKMIGQGALSSASFPGLIGSVQVYNRALSTPEVQQNYNALKGKYFGTTLTSCSAILSSGKSTGSGIYTISPNGVPLQVYCDMTNDGGGWTLVLQNNSTITTPSPNWNNSIWSNNVSGTLGSSLTTFDNLVGLGYWNSIGSQLRAEIGASPTSISHKATYNFSLNASNHYSLNLTNQSLLVGGNAPGLYYAHNGAPFSTYDSDNDSNGSGNCATYYSNHPWWYTYCWDGNFFAGGSGYQEAPYWTSSTTDYYAYGSIWIK